MIAITTFTITVVTELETKPDGFAAHIKEPALMGNTAFVGEGFSKEFGTKLHEQVKYAVLHKIAEKVERPEGYAPIETDNTNIKVN